MNYILEFALLLFLFAFLYRLLLQGKSNYNLLRCYILGSFVSSFYIPFLPNFSLAKEKLSILLPEVLISAAIPNSVMAINKVENILTIPNLLFVTFLLITGIFLVRFFWSFIKINKIILSSPSNTKMIYSDQINSPCSFMNYILLPIEHAFQDDELNAIILHEELHIAHRHSIEKIIIEFIKSCLWWHPATWYLSKELNLIHEYQVDQAMTSEMNTTDYTNILVKLILQPQGLALSNPISSNIKKRITMMNSAHNSVSPFGLFSIFTILCIGIISIHSCQVDEQQTSATTKIVETSKGLKKVTTIKEPSITSIDTIVVFDPENMTEKMNLIYKNPDVMPVFEGCDPSLTGEALEKCSQQKLLQFIYKNLVYPKQAKDNNIEGMILVKFVINESGKIDFRKYIREESHGLKESVDAVLDLMDEKYTWIPGKHEGQIVKVEFTLPVKFKLQ